MAGAHGLVAHESYVVYFDQDQSTCTPHRFGCGACGPAVCLDFAGLALGETRKGVEKLTGTGDPPHRELVPATFETLIARAWNSLIRGRRRRDGGLKN